MADLLETGLAAWALAWALSFWHKADPLRERLGVYHVQAEGYVDRDDCGGLGGWLNCPACTAVLAVPLARVLKPLRPLLAALGVALLCVRWWEAARPKAEWWR